MRVGSDGGEIALLKTSLLLEFSPKGIFDLFTDVDSALLKLPNSNRVMNTFKYSYLASLVVDNRTNSSPKKAIRLHRCVSTARTHLCTSCH